VLIVDATCFGGPSPSGIKRIQMGSLSGHLISDIGATVKMKDKKN